MRIITPTPELDITTPNAVVSCLAAPSRGSTELATWKVRMEPDAAGPEHTADAEQVWLLTAGALEFAVDGQTRTATVGEAVILPAGSRRRVHTGAATPAEALVATRAGCQVHVTDEPAPRALPWAE
jgi:quercetin dioxygenase-like cupin family protein